MPQYCFVFYRVLDLILLTQALYLTLPHSPTTSLPSNLPRWTNHCNPTMAHGRAEQHAQHTRQALVEAEVRQLHVWYCCQLLRLGLHPCIPAAPSALDTIRQLQHRINAPRCCPLWWRLPGC